MPLVAGVQLAHPETQRVLALQRVERQPERMTRRCGVVREQAHDRQHRAQDQSPRRPKPPRTKRTAARPHQHRHGEQQRVVRPDGERRGRSQSGQRQVPAGLPPSAADEHPDEDLEQQQRRQIRQQQRALDNHERRQRRQSRREQRDPRVAQQLQRQPIGDHDHQRGEHGETEGEAARQQMAERVPGGDQRRVLEHVLPVVHGREPRHVRRFRRRRRREQVSRGDHLRLQPVQRLVVVDRQVRKDQPRQQRGGATRDRGQHREQHQHSSR